MVGEFCKKTIMKNVDIEDLPPPLPVEFVEYSYKVRHLVFESCGKSIDVWKQSKLFLCYNNMYTQNLYCARLGYYFK